MFDDKIESAIDKLKQFNKYGEEMEDQKSFHFIFALDHSGSMCNKDDGRRTRWEDLV